MFQYEALRQQARERGEQLHSEASAERLALEARRTRSPRSGGIALAAALKLRSAFGPKGSGSTAYRPSA